MEIWKKIEWIGGKKVTTYKDYFVSNLGNIKREDYQLKPFTNPDGYLFVNVYTIKNEGGLVRGTIAVHRIVAAHFIPNPDNLPEVNHKTGDKTKNAVNDLEWCTRSYNVKHSFELGLSKPKVGSENPNSKLDEKLVHEICKLISEGKANVEIVRTLSNVTISDVSNIKNRSHWKHVSKHYNFDNSVEAIDRPYSKKDLATVLELIYYGYANKLILRVVPGIKKHPNPNRFINRIRSGETYRKEYSEVQRLSKA